MNVFRYELKSSRFSTILWIIAISSLSALYMSIYPAFAKDATAILDILKNLPPAAKQITGLGGDLELFSFLGFLASIFPFITLIGAIQASVMGFTILSKETVAKTTDFLLTKPKTRTSIFWQKTASSVMMLLITQTVVTGMVFLLANWFNAGDFDKGQFLMFWGAFALIQYFMFALCVLLSQIVKKIKATTPPALGLSFGMFLLAIFALVIGDDNIRWITPFRFIDYKKIITDGTYDPAHLLYAVTLFTAFIVTSYYIYTRRDVPSAI